jgi:hypothetical protein
VSTTSTIVVAGLILLAGEGRGGGGVGGEDIFRKNGLLTLNNDLDNH